MSKLSVAVCDENRSYGESVSTCLFVEQGKDFSGCSFSSPEVFKAQYDRQRFQVVLLGKAFIQEVWIQEEMKQAQKILWIYLKEEGEKTEELAELLPAVEKYQPVSMLVRSIYRYYEEYQKEDVRVLGKKSEVLGWFSPDHNIWQTPMAMTMASLLAEKEKVLYVNLKECSGFEKWFEEDYEQDLLDVMYFCQKSEQKSVVELGKYIYSLENLDYIPPVRDAQLLCELEEEDYVRLMERLEQESAYDVIVLDMGSMFPGFFDIWKRCRQIYIPREQNVLAKGVGREFEELVKRLKERELESRIFWLPLPDWSKETIGAGCMMQQWLWGGPGDYVREILDGRIRRA